MKIEKNYWLISMAVLMMLWLAEAVVCDPDVRLFSDLLSQQPSLGAGGEATRTL
jgi:hypothetical protein